MFNIFDEVAPCEKNTKAEIYESGFIPSVAGTSIHAEVLNEKREISYQQMFPVLFGGCVGLALFTMLNWTFSLLLVASLLSLYRR